MKIKVSFSELSSVLGYVNTILSDKTVEEKMKNVIFLVNEEEVTVVGYSHLTFARTAISDAEIEGVEGNWSFQLKLGEINKIISSYSTLFKTKVEYIEFEKNEVNNKIKVIIQEEPINEEDENFAQTSRFIMDNVPLVEKVLNEIMIEFPEEVDSFPSESLLRYMNCLYPLMNNDSASSLASKLNFAEDYVFVMSSYISTFFKNVLPDSFKGIALGYSSVGFLKKLCEGTEFIEVKRIPNYLCIESNGTQAFLKYQRVKVNHKPYIQGMSNENGIQLDRLYLKDVLKRMLVFSQDGIAEIKDLGLEVSNKGFNQVIPILKKKGNVDNLKFKLPVSTFVKSIVGDDNGMAEELYLFFVATGRSGNGYSLFVKDRTGAWFSTLQVRTQ